MLTFLLQLAQLLPMRSLSMTVLKRVLPLHNSSGDIGAPQTVSVLHVAAAALIENSSECMNIVIS